MSDELRDVQAIRDDLVAFNAKDWPGEARAAAFRLARDVEPLLSALAAAQARADEAEAALTELRAIKEADVRWESEQEARQLREANEAERQKFQAETVTTSFLAARLRGDNPSLAAFRLGISVGLERGIALGQRKGPPNWS